jgi:hypothetical protein
VDKVAANKSLGNLMDQIFEYSAPKLISDHGIEIRELSVEGGFSASIPKGLIVKNHSVYETENGNVQIQMFST